MSPTDRSRVVARIAARLARRSCPRLLMFCIVVVTVAAGFQWYAPQAATIGDVFGAMAAGRG